MATQKVQSCAGGTARLLDYHSAHTWAGRSAVLGSLMLHFSRSQRLRRFESPLAAVYPRESGPRDVLLQVIDLQKSRAVEARDSAEEHLRAAARERDNFVQQLSELRAAHEAALEAAAWKARYRCNARCLPCHHTV